MWSSVARGSFLVGWNVWRWSREVSLEQSIDQGLVLLGHAVNTVSKFDDVLWWVVWMGRVCLMIGGIMVGGHGPSRDHTPGRVRGKR
ncbi:unnamed protein product [Camellia sinensis]